MLAPLASDPVSSRPASAHGRPGLVRLRPGLVRLRPGVPPARRQNAGISSKYADRAPPQASQLRALSPCVDRLQIARLSAVTPSFQGQGWPFAPEGCNRAGLLGSKFSMSPHCRSSSGPASPRSRCRQVPAPKLSPDVPQLFVAGHAIAFAHRIKQQRLQEGKCNSNN